MSEGSTGDISSRHTTTYANYTFLFSAYFIPMKAGELYWARGPFPSLFPLSCNLQISSCYLEYNSIRDDFSQKSKKKKTTTRGFESSIQIFECTKKFHN